MPVPLIIDTDPGIDDMLAILTALASPELNLLAVTTTFGNVGIETTTANAGRVLALAGREDIPIAAGASRPSVFPAPETAADIHGSDGIGGLSERLPAPFPPGTKSAVELMAEVIRTSEHPVTIAAIGPLTNIAALLTAHPELAHRIAHIVVMGGAVRGGNTSSVAEFNIRTDPEAAHRTLNDDVAVTLVGLDATRDVPVDESWLDELASGGSVARTAADITRRYNAYFAARGRTSFEIHDAVTIAALVDPALITTTRARVSVDCGQGPARGATVVQRLDESAVGPAVQVALGADGERIRTLISTRLCAL